MSDYAVPVLASLNLSQTWKFYRYFGFELVGPSQDDLGGDDAWQACIRRGSVELMFERTSTDYTRDENVRFSRNCRILVSDLDAWHRAFAHTKMNWRNFYPRLSPPEMRGGQRGFIIVDRDANLLHFVENPLT